MPSAKTDTVAVACPHCGHSQPEPRTAYSTICRSCRQHFRVQEALRPVSKPAAAKIEGRQVRCFQCGTVMEAPKAAESTMCKRCSCHIDLRDYEITATVSKSFRTHGRLVVTEKGYMLNTEAVAREAIIRGRLIGKITTEGRLEVHSTANIKGTFTAGELVIPTGQHFRWAEPLQVGSAEIGGELVANLCSSGTVRLKSTARMFGNIHAANLVVDAGAVFVGNARVGTAAHL